MKHTKKLLAAVMALAMVSAVAPMSIFAEDTVITNANKPWEANMTATYDVDATYTVTIPSSVALSASADVTSNITANNVLLEKGQNITVTLTGGSNTDTGTTFHAKMADSNSTADYTISVENDAEELTPVAVGGTVATFAAGTVSQSKTLTFSKVSGWSKAGNHTETLTFTIATN